MIALSTDSELETRMARAIAAAPALWHSAVARRARWLGAAFGKLRDAHDPAFAANLAELESSSGLSAAMLRWALDSALGVLDSDSLLALDAAIPAPHPHAVRARAGELCVVVLAGNLFTAAARAVALPLLLGVPVLVKTAAHDVAFSQLLARALKSADPELAQAFQYVCFSSDERARVEQLLARADIVCAYGSDDTLQQIRAQLRATTRFIGHGHGLGAAFVDQGALQSEERAQEAAAGLALDVAAYDQRGCMSPLVAWVRRGQTVTPERFARHVFEALATLALRLPRGPLPLASASAQLSFRGVAALRGTLLEGEGFCVSHEGDAALRVSPGYRNLQILDVDDQPALLGKLAPLGVHLKCLGVAGVEDTRALIADFSARVAPRVCALGDMQRPKLGALHDGVAAWEGLLRYSEEDS